MKINRLLILTVLFSCTTKQKNPKDETTLSTNPQTEIIETFTDSVNIGEKGNCKIELIKHRVLKDIYVIVKFYTRGFRSWTLQNTYVYECNVHIMDLQPNISDFNNDKFKDITFISATAARLANEVRRLFVYNDSTQNLISIVNAEDYPNMRYNKELDCIDALLVHGGSTNVFARIEGDSLKNFAIIQNDNNRTVYEIDKLGKETLIRKDTLLDPEDIFARYDNYKPLK